MISVLASPFFLSHYNMASEAMRIFPLCLLLHPLCDWEHTSLPTQGSGPPKSPKHPVTCLYFRRWKYSKEFLLSLSLRIRLWKQWTLRN